MPYATVTWSTLRARLYERLDHKRFWVDEELRLAFNEALSLWNLLTGTWKRRETITTVANRSLYVLSTSMLYRTRMTFNNYPLIGSSRFDLNHGRYQWRADTTATGGSVPTRPTIWVPVSLELFYLWPMDAVGGGTLTVDGVATTPVLIEDSDTVDANDALLTTLLNFSVHVLAFKKGGPAFAATQPFYQTFLKEAAEQNSQLKATNLYRRVMGLDGRDLKVYHGVPTLLDSVKA